MAKLPTRDERQHDGAVVPVGRASPSCLALIIRSGPPETALVKAWPDRRREYSVTAAAGGQGIVPSSRGQRSRSTQAAPTLQASPDK